MPESEFNEGEMRAEFERRWNLEHDMADERVAAEAARWKAACASFDAKSKSEQDELFALGYILVGDFLDLPNNTTTRSTS